MYAKLVKPALDTILALLAGMVLLPVMLLIALLIKLDTKGPVLFYQKRVGRKKKYFRIVKFRTMHANTPKDVPTHLLQNPGGQITKIGRFLRRYSLDELPQIGNILLGQMSIIGPRPALWNQDDLVKARDACGANMLRPGLTGYAQVNGRDELPIDVKAKLDGYYAENLSFIFDVKIFFTTIKNAFMGKNVVEGATGADAEDEKKD